MIEKQSPLLAAKVAAGLTTIMIETMVTGRRASSPQPVTGRTGTINALIRRGLVHDDLRWTRLGREVMFYLFPNHVESLDEIHAHALVENAMRFPAAKIVANPNEARALRQQLEGRYLRAMTMDGFTVGQRVEFTPEYGRGRRFREVWAVNYFRPPRAGREAEGPWASLTLVESDDPTESRHGRTMTTVPLRGLRVAEPAPKTSPEDDVDDLLRRVIRRITYNVLREVVNRVRGCAAMEETEILTMLNEIATDLGTAPAWRADQ